ncbi:MAG: zinc ribbon domain-containing protein [Lachnospiraceae bacterium]|nr:zinc ribbon domain-containing protein [Lachnospiraceae bacterium]
MVCNNCGATLPDDSMFCEKCGTRIVQYQQPMQQMPQQQQYQQPMQQMPQMQPQYQQPMPQMPQQPYPPQGKSGMKSSTVLIIVLSIVGTLLIAGVGIFLIMNQRSQNVKSETKVSEKEDKSKDSSKSKKKDKKAKEEENSGSEAEEEKDTSSDQADVNQLTGEEAKAHAAALSTTDRPTDGDFQWLADAYYDGKDLEDIFDIEGATVLTNPELVEGDWKACFRTKRGMDEGDNDFYRLFNVNINTVNDKVTMTFDWYYYNFGDEEGKEDQYDDGKSYGKWNADHTGIDSDDGDFIMKKFIELNGQQYAYGEYYYESGEQEYLILSRPGGVLDTSHVFAGESRRVRSKAPSSHKLSNEEIAALCAKHCGSQYARVDSVNADGTIVVQVYDEVDGHTTTYDWYTVNTDTLDATTEFGFNFNLNDDR